MPICTRSLPLDQVPNVPSHSPCGCLPQGVVVLFCWFCNVSCTQWTSCDISYESLRFMFLSLDVRFNIHVARNVGLTLFVTVAPFCLRLYYKEMRSLDAKSRATCPTFIKSFFVVRRGEGLPSRILTVAGPVPEGLVRRARHPSRSTRLG